MADPQTIQVFDAELQQEAAHTVDIDQNGEIVLTSVETGRFLKFPAGTSPAELEVLLGKHKEENTGQLSMAVIEEEKAAIIEQFVKPTPQE